MAQTEKATEHQHDTPETFAQQWSHLRGKINTWWDRLTNADLEQVAGNREQLIRMIQTRYGYARERAEQEVERRLREYYDTAEGSKGGRLGDTVTATAQGVASSVAGTAGEVSTKVQDMASKAATAATAVAGTAARGSAYLPDVAGDLAGFIRRYPLPSLLAGMGLGFLLARFFGQGWMGSGDQESTRQSEAGYPNAMIQCSRCGQMIRQADIVHHSTICSGPSSPGQGGSPA